MFEVQYCFGPGTTIRRTSTDVRFAPKSGHSASWLRATVIPAKRRYKNLQASRLRLTGVHLLIRGTCWANLRRAHRFGHTVEDHDALTAAARRERFISAREAAVDVFASC